MKSFLTVYGSNPLPIDPLNGLLEFPTEVSFVRSLTRHIHGIAFYFRLYSGVYSGRMLAALHLTDFSTYIKNSILHIWHLSLLPLSIAFCCCLGLSGTIHAEELIKSGSDLTTEFWEGRVLTARFKVGMCFERDGKARGVLILRHLNGKEDTYHLYGTLKNNSFDLSHSSGHYFNGELTGPDSMAGKVKLNNGMNLTLKGHRTRNVTLKAPDCAPHQ